MVERHVANVDVAGSNPVSRSRENKTPIGVFLFLERTIQLGGDHEIPNGHS